MKYFALITGEYNDEVLDMAKMEIEKSIWELLNKGDILHFIYKGDDIDATVKYKLINTTDNEALLDCDM